MSVSGTIVWKDDHTFVRFRKPLQDLSQNDDIPR